MGVAISIIIPAYNEARYIVGAIRSVQSELNGRHAYELLVIDHGSKDDTVMLARSCGATVHVVPEGTVSHLRNVGVAHSQGEMLVFIDADVTLAPGWHEHFTRVLDTLGQEPMTITGSQYRVPVTPSWLERYWFKPLNQRRNHYINGGHLITTRTLFQRIGGFREQLETGEDYEFCKRAQSAGARIIDEPTLWAFHHGYPKTLRAFFRRERWHGKGDFTSLADVAASKVAMATVLFALMHLCWGAGALSGSVGLASLLAGGGIAAMCLNASAMKYRHAGIRVVTVNALLFYVYFAARAMAAMRMLLDASPRKRVRVDAP